MCAGACGREVCVSVGLRVGVVRAVRFERRGAYGGGKAAEAGLGGAGDGYADAAGVLARDFRGVVGGWDARLHLDGWSPWWALASLGRVIFGEALGFAIAWTAEGGRRHMVRKSFDC